MSTLFKIKKPFADAKKLPVYFIGEIVQSSKLAYKIQGEGISLKNKGICSICGRTLTNASSKLIGIGPICMARLKIEPKGNPAQAIEKFSFLEWFPISCIIEKVSHSRKIKVVAQKPQPKIAKQISNEILELSFPYDANIVAKIKTIYGRRFIYDSKTWVVPINEKSLTLLCQLKFTLDLFPLNPNEPDKKVLAKKQKELLREPYPFQAEGIDFLVKAGGRALIADEMGLGKTIQAIGWMHTTPVKTVIVVPASLKLNWENEIKMTLPDKRKVLVVNGGAYQDFSNEDILIINYNILGQHEKEIIKQKFQAIILDEAHFIKNKKTQRTKACLKIMKTCKHVIGLTGTPVLNRPKEIYNIIHSISPNLLGKLWDFKKQFCDLKIDYMGHWDDNGASNIDELNGILKRVMLRRLKKDVLTQLPPKTRQPIYLEMKPSVMKEYNKASKNYLQWVYNNKGRQAVEKAKGAKALTQMETLKQLAMQGKLESAIKWIRDYLETGEKLVVMATHKVVIGTLIQIFEGIAVKVDGSCTVEQRQKAVDSFQKDSKIKLFVGNIQSAGVGLTLTAAKAVAFIEFAWTPGDMLQAEDRVHRIGQVADNVLAYYLLAKGTIDLTIMDMLNKKFAVTSGVADGGFNQDKSLLQEVANAL